MLRLTGIELRRGTRLLLENVSFLVAHGEKVALTGANGSGKTSLIEMMRGEMQPDAGELDLPANVVIACVAQHDPHGERAAIEYVLDGDRRLRDIEKGLAQEEAGGNGTRLATLHADFETHGGFTARSRAARLMAGLGFAPDEVDRAVDSFSGGWRKRLNLAQALMCPSDLLLLDEPTNHLDLDAVLWLEAWLRHYAGTLLLISHDREFLDAVVGRVLHIEHSGIHSYAGNYSAFEQHRAIALAHREAMRKKQEREVAHIQDFVRRFRYKASKARQAQSRIKALERMEQIAPAHADSPFRFSFPEPVRLPRPLLRLEDLDAGYASTTILRGVELALQPGDRIALLGANGAGKSTLVRTLAGRLTPLGGLREAAPATTIGYFAQHQVEELHPDEGAFAHLARMAPDAREQEIRNFLGGFGFGGDRESVPASALSGGEKARLALALLVYARPNLLLLDEPTNHLDMDMRQALAFALQEYAGAMVLVSHDRHLIRSTCDSLLLVADGDVAEFDGDLDEYAVWLARSRAAAGSDDNGEGEGGQAVASAAHSAQNRKDRKRQEAEERQRLAPLRNELKALEKTLEQQQHRQEQLEKQLADPQLYDGEQSDRISEMLAESNTLRLAIAQAEERWLELSTELED